MVNKKWKEIIPCKRQLFRNMSTLLFFFKNNKQYLFF